MAGIRCQVFNF